MVEPWVDITTRSKMNQKAAYSVLFCALLASTFVHELRAKGVAPVSSRHHQKALQSRTASSQTCELTCTWVQNVNTWNITIEVVNNLLVISNLTAAAAIVIDVSAQIVLVLNGTSGAGVAINIATQSGVSFTSGLWVGGSVELHALLTVKLSAGLKALWSLAGAVTFTFTAITVAQLTIIAQVLVFLVANVKLTLEANVKQALTILLSIGKGFIVVIQTLKGILTLIANEIKIEVAKDVTAVLVILQTLTVLIQKAAGVTEDALNVLIGYGIALKLSVILAAKNGIEALAQVIIQFAVVASVAVALGAYLSTSLIVLVCLRGLGGGVTGGVNGVLTIIAIAAELQSNLTSIELCISKVIQFVVEKSVSVNLTSEINVALNALVSVVAQIGGNSSLGACLDVIVKLQTNALKIGLLDISLIITTLIGVSTNLLALVVTIVAQLASVQASAQLGVYLILVLCSKLSSKAGLLELIALGIAVPLSFNLLSILSAAFTLVLNLLAGKIFEALKALSGIGTILTAVAALWASGVAGLAAALLLYKNVVFAWLGIFGVVGLTFNSSATSAAQSIQQCSTNATYYSSLSFAFEFSASASGSGSVSSG